jgi:hypothetical protein
MICCNNHQSTITVVNFSPATTLKGPRNSLGIGCPRLAQSLEIKSGHCQLPAHAVSTSDWVGIAVAHSSRPATSAPATFAKFTVV